MSCSPEISRANGRKSRGAKTSRGKQIASLNATKHGLLAKKPPALGEELVIFQEFKKELTDEFQPESSSEILLIEQVAMGRMRLYRLWGAESAMAILALTPPPKESAIVEKYPYYKGSNDDIKGKTIFHPDNRQIEWELILMLIEGVKRYVELSKDVRKSYFSSIWQQWLDMTETVVAKFLGEHPDKTISINPLYYFNANEYTKACQKFFQEQRDKRSLYGEVSQLQRLIQIAQEDFVKGQFPTKKKQLHSTTLQFYIERVEEKCKERLSELDTIEQEIEAAEMKHEQMIAEYQDLTRRSKVIPPQVELLSRYERHIVHTMNDALEQLRSIQMQRKQGHYMGSFGSLEMQ